MTERERKAAYAWDHIKQAGSTLAKRGDTLLPGYRELKKMGVVTIDGAHVRLAGDYRRAFLAGEDLPSWADLSVGRSTARHHAARKKSPAQLDREIAEALAGAGSSSLFEEAKAEQARLEEESDAAGAALRIFPRGAMGLTPDAVKATPEYRAAKVRADKAFARLRDFNSVFVKRFATELRAERDARTKERESRPPR